MPARRPDFPARRFGPIGVPPRACGYRLLLALVLISTLEAGCAALQAQTLRPVELVEIRVTRLDSVELSAIFGLRLNHPPASAGCIGRIQGTVRVEGGHALSIPPQEACPRIQGGHGWLDVRVTIPHGSLGKAAISALLSGRPHIEVNIRAADGIGRLAPSLHFGRAIAVRFPLGLHVTATAAQSWIQLGALQFDGLSLSGISIAAEVSVHNPTSAEGQLIISQAKLHVGSLLLASGGHGRAPLIPTGLSKVTIGFGGAPIGAAFGLAKLARDGQVTVCAAFHAELAVGRTGRGFEVRACRTVGAVELATAIVRGALL